MTVLLLDDESLMRKMVKLVLQRRGFQVLDAADSAGAMRLAESCSIDLLVTDIVLGDTDGWTVARGVAELHPNVSIVFTSGYPADFENKRKEYSRCTFLPKPFQPQDLMEAISRLLSQQG